MHNQLRQRLLACVSAVAMSANIIAPAAAAVTAKNDGNTTTPIKHVIVIVGENRTFDHLFATYVPKTGTVDNLLSKGIVKADGTPGKNVALAKQYSAVTRGGVFQIAPRPRTAYTTLPPLLTGGTPMATRANGAPLNSLTLADLVEPGLEQTNGMTSLFPNVSPGANGNDAYMLTTGASGLANYSVDTRVANAAAPKNAPIPLTGGSSTLTYDDYTSSPVHRFYQMFQQMDCSAASATAANPSGCLEDLWPWVEVTIGAGNNGSAQSAAWNNMSSGEGSTSMTFYNVNNGDVPYFKWLQDTYAFGDNYHQPVKGGTGADSVVLGFATLPYYTAPQGSTVANSSDYANGLRWLPAVPPTNQIENPTPKATPESPTGANNWYTNDGYSGGTYSECANTAQPGVASIVNYMKALSYTPHNMCFGGQYYLLNNYNPGYVATVPSGQTTPVGQVAPVGPTIFTIPPQIIPSIANVLDKADVSWTYYGEGWNQYAGITTSYQDQAYCNICNPFLYQQYVMENPKKVATNLKDTTDLYADLAKGVLPAVSYVKPGGLNDGHPTSSKFGIFEAFTKKIIDAVQASPTLAGDTAIMITVDEGGGYYDSGFVQTVDWAGDGTRIPMIVVSPFSKGVGPVHEYGDHASFLKFVEANWSLPTITSTTRDNLPNPTPGPTAYVPGNMPAIGDLMSYFSFPPATAK